MKKITRADGNITFTLPDTASEPKDIKVQRTRQRRGVRATAEPIDQEIENLLHALTDDEERGPESQDYQVFNRFSIDLGEGKKQVRRRGVTARPDEMGIDVTLGPDEGAVMLIEQDGTYEWHFPEKTAIKRGRRRPAMRGRIGGGRQGAGGQKTAVFRIPIGEGEALGQRRGAARTHRGPVTNFIKGKIKGFILKFAVRKVVGALSSRLEKGVKAGPVIITSYENTEGWHHKDDYLSYTLPKERPARILLLVHGTFSSTHSSFGALTVQPAGQRFLKLALQHYDAVLGYDHHTLSKTPAENAEALFEDLIKLQAKSKGIEFDAISFSRGGLVYRYLTEQIVPYESTQMAFRKSIFVACTNAGTELANDDNWKHLVDFYTNMVAGTCRLLSMFPGTRLPAKILNQTIKTIGSLAKYMAQDAVEDNAVPGLSAMEPAGRFVEAINKLPASRTRPGATSYYAMGSDFEPDRDTYAGELGKRLAIKVADGVIDKLMGEANDLVVDTDSMFIVDPVPSARLIEKLPFGENGEIYHTVYFNQPQVARQCSHWLGLVQATRGETTGAPRGWWNEAVSDDFRIVSGQISVKEAMENLEDDDSRFVVIERPHSGELLHYGVPRNILMESMRSHTNKQADLVEMLDLHEYQSRGISLDEALEATGAAELNNRAGPEYGRYTSVVLDDTGPVGVVTPPGALSSDELLEEAAPPKRGGRGNLSTKASRTYDGGARANAGFSEPGRDIAAAPEPKTVWCNAHAVMPEEAVIGKKTGVEVTLSRDKIIRQSGLFGGGNVQVEKNLIVMVMARKHCKVSGDRQTEVPVPAPGEETPLYFDVIPKHEGIGQVDVIVRQGNRAITTLKFYPRFVSQQTSDEVEPIVAETELTPLDSRRVLRDRLNIIEGQMGNKPTLIFQFLSGTLGVDLHCESEPFKDADIRQEYITSLYMQIEDFWADDEQEYDAFMSKLRSRGVDIFKKLIPKELQRVLWKERDKLKTIQVFSEDPFIPWELAYLTEPGRKATPGSYFLAEKGLVRWHMERGEVLRRPPKELRLRDGKAAYVIPAYPRKSGYQLSGAQDERKMLEKVLNAKPITPTSLKVETALQTPGKYDIVHFACHGLANPDEIWNAGVMMKGKMKGSDYQVDEYLASQVEATTDLQEEGAPGPIVFLNACQVGRQGYNLTGTGGFARAFVMSGAGAFISTHWSVGDIPAYDFSETLYKKLLDGKNMMTAVAAARKAAKNKEEVTWLSYVVYADPYARIV